jgi:hypothetical protein
VKYVLPLFALIVACSEPTVPTRQAAYAFDDGFGDVFRWPENRLPVRFFADSRGAMPTLVERGIGVWAAQFLYGEFTGVVWDDSVTADVIVVWSGAVPPDVPPDSGAPVTACSGITRLVIDSASNALDSAIVIRASRLAVPATDAQVAACFRRVITHELGHSMGLLQHSAQGTDLMAPDPIVDAPTARDRATAEVLYHTAPTIGPPPR